MKRRLVWLLILAAGLIPIPAIADNSPLTTASPLPQDRSVEPVVLTGAQFPGWSAGPETSAREPTNSTLNSDCPSDSSGNHNCSQHSRVPSNPRDAGIPVDRAGVAVDRLIGYRWDQRKKTFVQIPFQIDERFTRYISNLASNCTAAGPFCVGFGGYAATDAQLSFVYDQERYRFTESSPDNPCVAVMKPGDAPMPDPLPGLDDNDEIAFLYRDGGWQAPEGAVPPGVVELRQVRIDDPSAPHQAPRFAYVGLAPAAGGAVRHYDADNGYMSYVRSADADYFQSTSSNYGNAPRGPHCDANGNVVGNGPRRPRDTAWVLTPRYAFRYESRWALRGVRVAEGSRKRPLDSPSEYGPPLVDQWKARAYQQSPGDTTPCCGFETEQDNWPGSSVTLGERWGPVRVIRTTWGADSGTNVIRQEIFYPDTILQQSYLRVHPIPPLGGIFAYWDHTAGVVTKFYNPQVPDGVNIDGANDEKVGTAYVAVRQGSVEVRDDDPIPVVGPQSVTVGSGGSCFEECTNFDVTDPTLNATGTLSWEEVSGDHGAIVFRSRVHQVTPAGTPQAFFAIPYFRDDSCFDDGTGIDPGPHLRRKEVDDGTAVDGVPANQWRDPATGEVHDRQCWKPADGPASGDPTRDRRWFQGAIGSHGVQVLMNPETDNASMTVPVDELDSEQRMVVLPGNPGNVGDRYGYAADLPLQTNVADLAAADPTSVTIGGDTSGLTDDKAHFEATLQDRLGPVSGATLRLTFQGSSYDATTSDNGKAVFDNVPIAGPAGTETVEVTYEGDTVRSPGYQSSPFEVKDVLATGIDYDGETSGTIGQKARVSALLSAENGKPLAGMTITFKRGDQTTTATTGPDGVAEGQLKIEGPPGTNKPMVVSFAGQPHYLPSSINLSFDATPPGKFKPVAFVAAGSLALMALLAALLLFRMLRLRRLSVSDTIAL